jgi:hypothetical protein
MAETLKELTAIDPWSINARRSPSRLCGHGEYPRTSSWPTAWRLPFEIAPWPSAGAPWERGRRTSWTTST